MFWNVFKVALGGALVACLAVALLTLVVSQSTAPAVATADESGPLYAKKCSSCHGKDGQGNEKFAGKFKVDVSALDLIDEATQGKTDEELIRITAEGAGKMPAYAKKLTPEQVQGVVDFLRKLAEG